MQPRLRSTSKRFRSRRAPGGRSAILTKPKKTAKAHCAICGTKLHAVPNRDVAAMHKLSKTQKRPERVFGGVLCSNCTSDILRAKARLDWGALQREDVDLRHLRFIDSLKRRINA